MSSRCQGTSQCPKRRILWRIVDSKGDVFLLDRVKIKDEKIDTRVQFWCAFVEVVLGEASFAKPVALNRAR